MFCFLVLVGIDIRRSVCKRHSDVLDPRENRGTVMEDVLIHSKYKLCFPRFARINSSDKASFSDLIQFRSSLFHFKAFVHKKARSREL